MFDNIDDIPYDLFYDGDYYDPNWRTTNYVHSVYFR
jgi:hypothetical protein